MRKSAVLLVVAVLSAAAAQEYIGHALFVRTSDDDTNLAEETARSRVQRAAPASPADVMAQNILEWIQGIYRQGARKIRQQSESNAYLPPYSTQRPPEKPRPFQTASPPVNEDSSGYSPNQNEVTNYPYQQPSALYTPQNSAAYSPPEDTRGLSASASASATASASASSPVSSSSSSPFTFSTPNSLYASASSLRPSSTYVPQGTFGSSTSYNPRPSGLPSYAGSSSLNYASVSGSTTYLPPSNTGNPYSPTTSRPAPNFPSTTQTSSTYLPPQYSGFPSSSPSSRLPSSTPQPPKLSPGSYPSQADAFSTTYLPPRSNNFPTQSSGGGYPSPPSGFTPTYGYTSQRPTPNFPTSGGTGAANGPQGYDSKRPTPPFPSGGGTPGTAVSEDGYAAGVTPSPPLPTPGPGAPGTSTTGTAGSGGTDSGDDDLKHPPHIHNISVECGKTMMTINIEFNRVFDGVIYSKGFFMNPDCRYVEQNSGKKDYSFTVSLDSCGTQFINDFQGEAGQAYLENVLVLQNEPGIQEVWDTVRRVRCLWEGNINKALSVNLSVDMLNQEIVTFSGDTAMARLDIQIGKGPFAPIADGLVKIGETMTLVVSVEGDPAFDLQVRDCIARDESNTNTLQLTDERGCILKPKLFGAFQKTNDTGNTGASIIAYAYFQAFKFPDVMDLFIECNVELCKTDCEPCPEANQQIEPGRRRRSVLYSPSNTTSASPFSDPVRVGRGLKVILLDDLSTLGNHVAENTEKTTVEEVSKEASICMSNNGFYAVFSLMLGFLVSTTLSAATFYVKLQRVHRSKSTQS